MSDDKDDHTLEQDAEGFQDGFPPYKVPSAKMLLADLREKIEEEHRFWHGIGSSQGKMACDVFSNWLDTWEREHGIEKGGK